MKAERDEPSKILSHCFYSYIIHPCFFLTGECNDATVATYWTTLTAEVMRRQRHVLPNDMAGKFSPEMFSEFVGERLCGVEYLWHTTRKLQINDIIGFFHTEVPIENNWQTILAGNLLMLWTWWIAMHAPNYDGKILIVVRDMASRISTEKRTQHVMTKKCMQSVYVEYWALCIMVMRWLTIIPGARVGYEMIENQRGSWNTYIALSDDPSLFIHFNWRIFIFFIPFVTEKPLWGVANKVCMYVCMYVCMFYSV